MNRLEAFQTFMDSIDLDDDIHIGYGNDAVRPGHKPDIDDTYLRVFLGSTDPETLSIGGGCAETITNCESTIEIVTPSKKGLGPAIEIEEKIICAASRWVSVNSELKIGSNAVSSDPDFMEKLTRSVLPVNIKYRIIKRSNCNDK